MSAKKLIAFDWNGTLLDDAHVWREALNVLLTHFGKPPMTAESFLSFYDIPIQTLYRNAGCTEEQIGELPLLLTQTHIYYDKHSGETRLRDGAQDLLDLCANRNIPGVILSNYLSDRIGLHLQRLSIADKFNSVLAYPTPESQMSGLRKGERLAAHMKDRNIKPENVIVVGDTTEEIVIARELGAIGIAITGGFSSEERLTAVRPDYLIHSLHELLPILQEKRFAS